MESWLMERMSVMSLIVIVWLILFVPNINTDPDPEFDALLAFKKSLGNPDALSSWNASNRNCSTWVGLQCDRGTKFSASTISLMGMKLKGNLVSELGNLTSLQILSVADNQISGSIPKELGNLTNLIALSVADNQISGSIPKELGNLMNLMVLSVADNQISGSIPKEFEKLVNLSILNLTNNQLTGTIPCELVNLKSLKIPIVLSNNTLEGCYPKEFVDKFPDIYAQFITNSGLRNVCSSLCLNSTVVE